MPRLTLLLLLSLLSLLVACPPGGGDDDDDSAGDDDDSVAADAVCDDPDYEAPGAWASLDHDQRKQYMACLVLPEMTDLFQEFDDGLYADFSCETCHGADREDVDYEMPNGVAPLAISDFPFSQHEDERLRAYGEFMEDEVYPTMAEFLGLQPTPAQFSCYDCHEQD